MLNILIFLATSMMNPHIEVQGNRVLSHTIILNTVSNHLSEGDSVIALNILKLYLKHGFPFARVKILRSEDSVFVIIDEGPLARIHDVQVQPDKFKGLKDILPDLRGRIFTPSILGIIEDRVKTTGFLKLDKIGFLKTEDGIVLIVSVEEVASQSGISGVATGNAEMISGFVTVRFLSISGRPVDVRFEYSRKSALSRSLKFDLFYPFVHGTGFSFYGSYINEINGSISRQVTGAGFVFQVKGVSINQGVRSQDGEVFAESGFHLRNRIFEGLSNFVYREKKYRITSKLDLRMGRFDFGLLVFTQSDSTFQIDKLGGVGFLRGYPYSSIDATKGWCVKVDFLVLKPFFLFFDYGVVQEGFYRSTGAGLSFRNGEIIYGLRPGVSLFDGILTIALKIGF